MVLDRGVIQQVGSPLELYNTPANRFVAGFIGSPAMNFLSVKGEGRADGMSLQLRNGGQLTVPTRAADGVSEVGIRPEHIRLTNPGAGQLDGKASVVEQLGNTSFLYLDTPAGPLIVESDPGVPVHPGDNVGLTFDPARVHVFDTKGNARKAA